MSEPAPKYAVCVVCHRLVTEFARFQGEPLCGDCLTAEVVPPRIELYHSNMGWVVDNAPERPPQVQAADFRKKLDENMAKLGIRGCKWYTSLEDEINFEKARKEASVG